MNFLLESSRIIIRPFRTEDEEPFITMRQKPEVNKYLPKRTHDEYLKFVRDAAAIPESPINHWVVEKKGTGSFLGSCLLREYKTGGAGVIEIGYSFDSIYWGKGFASEMVSLLIPHAHTLPGFKKLVAVTEKENAGSRAVLLKAGFKDKGTVVPPDEDIELCYFEYESPV